MEPVKIYNFGFMLYPGYQIDDGQFVDGSLRRFNMARFRINDEYYDLSEHIFFPSMRRLLENFKWYNTDYQVFEEEFVVRGNQLIRIVVEKEIDERAIWMKWSITLTIIGEWKCLMKGVFRTRQEDNDLILKSLLTNKTETENTVIDTQRNYLYFKTPGEISL